MTEHWESIRFENLFSFVIGGDWGKDLDDSDPTLVKAYCIRGSEIKEWNRKKGRTAVLRKFSSASIAKRRLQEGDILVEISGGGPDQPVGRTVLIDKEILSFQPDTPKICTNFLRLIRLNATVEKSFVNYYLTYFYGTGEIINYQAGSNNLRNLKFPEYSKIDIPIPPIAEQQQIVSKLDKLITSVDKLKQRSEQIPKNLKGFRQAVLMKAVTGSLTEEWRNEKELEKWQVVKLGDIIEGIEAGKNFSCPEIPVSEGRVGLVKISAVTWEEFDPAETKTVDDPTLINPKYFIHKGDFLISRANTLELVGSSVIVKDIQYDIMLSDKVWRVSFSNDITKKYVHRFLKSPLGRMEIESRATGNQLSMRNLSQSNFRDINIPLPPLEEQEEIVKRIDALFSKTDLIEQKYNLLTTRIQKLPQAILFKAFQGLLVDIISESKSLT